MLFYEYFSQSPLELFGCLAGCIIHECMQIELRWTQNIGGKLSEKQVEQELSERIGRLARTISAGSSFDHISQLSNSPGEHSF